MPYLRWTRPRWCCMPTENPIRPALTATLVLVICTLAFSACSVPGVTATSCSQFLDEWGSSMLPSTKSVELLQDAYFDAHSDEQQVSSLKLAALGVKARTACESNPDSKLKDQL